MLPLIVLFAALKTATITPPFWNDLDRIKALCDPPPPKILKKIQDHPWKGGLEPVAPEGIAEHELELLEGKIPEDLFGILCRNGPGRLRVGNTLYGSWFDGDGLVSRLWIDGLAQRATYSAKYVENERFRSQKSIPSMQGDVPMAHAGAWTKRGLGKWWQNLFSIPTNPSNTNVLFLPREKNQSGYPELYALAEGGQPVCMDPVTLKTIGERAFKCKRRKDGVNSMFSAHYSKDPVSGQIYNHGIMLGLKLQLNLFKLDQWGNLLKQVSSSLPYETLVHDNVISERFFTVLIAPWKCPPGALISTMLGGKSYAEHFAWNPSKSSGTKAVIFSKDSLKQVCEVSLPLLPSYHLIDAFEEPNTPNMLTVRALAYNPPEANTPVGDYFADMYSAMKIPMCFLMEYKMDVTTGALVSSRRMAPETAPCELPDVNSGWSYRKRFVYLSTRAEGSDFANSLQKVDLTTEKCSDVISFGDGAYAGSPLFVPKPNPLREDDGYVFTQIYRSDMHCTEICILDARTMKKLALLRLQKPIPYQFHGAWWSNETSNSLGP